MPPIKPLNELSQEAFAILTRELGLPDTIRFLNQFSQGFGNYTEEREELFKDLSIDDIVREIRSR